MKNTLIGLLLISYPLIVYFGLPYVEPALLAIVFIILVLIRHFATAKSTSKSKIPHSNIVLFAILALLSFTSLTNSELALKFYPVVVSSSFLLVFAYSVFNPPSVVEIIARLRDDLDENGVVYTRKVTIVWCLFFVFNGAIASFTIFHPNPQVWLVYNGLISYILMGLLMLGEFGYRKIAKAKQAKSQTDEKL